MKNILVVSCFALVSLGVSCQNNDDITPSDAKDCEEIAVQKDLDLLTTDPFHIDTAYVENNCLKLKVNYGGGCGNVSFKMYRNTVVFESYPPQTMIKLTLDDKDGCKALIYKDLSYSLAEIKQQIGKPVLLRLENYKHFVLYE